MNLLRRRNRILLFIGFIAFLLLPLTIVLVSKEQENRSSAASGTSLTFTPESSADQPIQADTGDDITLDLMVQPGPENVVSFVKFVIEYDPTYVTVNEDDFIQNTDAFPETMEGPTLQDGTITGSVSVGSDPLKAITEPTKIGTLTLHTKKATGDAPTTVAYTAESQALSIGDNDDPKKSVLSNTGAAVISIGGETTLKDTVAPSEEEIPDDATETPPDTVDQPEITIDPDTTNLQFTAILDGIGAGGDSVNPTDSSLSNKSPKNTKRDITVAIVDENDEDVVRTDGQIVYDAKSGKFTGLIPMEEQAQAGTYSVILEMDKYLSVEVPDVDIVDGEVTDLGEVTFVAGDIVSDDTLDILDYNALNDCGYGASAPLPLDDPKSGFNSEACKKNQYAANTDLDDNGIIDSGDFNLFLRELSKQGADTSQPSDTGTTVTPTPAESGPTPEDSDTTPEE